MIEAKRQKKVLFPIDENDEERGNMGMIVYKYKQTLKKSRHVLKLKDASHSSENPFLISFPMLSYKMLNLRDLN